jgi:adenine/guanine phosphoribosyltransferase-like PRPP-binding protein
MKKLIGLAATGLVIGVLVAVSLGVSVTILLML